jgi:hypothetical protein
MIDDQLSPEEQNLVQQIQATSKPKLDATARDEIRQRMVNEFRTTVNGQAQPQSMRPRFSIPGVVALVAAIMIMVVIGLVITQIGGQPADLIVETGTITISSGNQVAVVPSQTFASTVDGTTLATIITPEVVPSVTPSASPTVEVTASSTPSVPIATQEVVVVIEGPITNIIDNTVMIYGYSIEVEPQHPILQVIEVGDVVRVQGSLGSDSAVVATVVSNIPNANHADGAAVTVGLDGPVEAINGNTIIVNGIAVQLASDASLLQNIQVGNFVSVQGNFQTSGSSIVLVVVNIAIINNTTIQSGCWYHEDGMGMGHWHCDGMGMGMGMGDDGMGMGG